MAGLGPARALQRAADGTPFSRQTVLDAARELASEPFRPPSPVPQTLQALDYDTYRQIRYRKDEAIWGQAPTPFSIELFAPGFLYVAPVDIQVVENARAYEVRVGSDSFETPTEAIGAAIAELGQFAGFRLHYPLNRPDYRDEFLLFQGASYFRAVSRGQIYGLSARGLAIDVAEPTGEEFPLFRRFWIERPAADANSIVVHAVLDSRRLTGAYRFGIYPGATTTLDIDVTLFARDRVEHLGLAPLTSMFLHGAVDASDTADYRPAVHDSQGLALHTGTGERLWRPLANPRTLQLSAFVDTDPRGFGLIQRARDFQAYQDLEAVYQRRPSAWVSPRGNWGAGHVQLVEIPTDKEINDNIVVYWRPEAVLAPGSPFSFAYRLTWPDQAPVPGAVARVARSAYGRALTDGRPQFVIDYVPVPGVPTQEVQIDASASAGRIAEALVQRNPQTGGLRVFVTLDPGAADISELRLVPTYEGEAIGETWLYRWLRG
ncbi:MAG: glucan biosynthesis protein G [Rhodothalassiaceae bacterium]